MKLKAKSQGGAGQETVGRERRETTLRHQHAGHVGQKHEMEML